jgi:hypothetical protein
MRDRIPLDVFRAPVVSPIRRDGAWNRRRARKEILPMGTRRIALATVGFG